MTTCRETTRLLSDASERPLTREERHKVERHFEICPACRRCAQQFTLLRTAMRSLKATRLEA